MRICIGPGVVLNVLRAQRKRIVENTNVFFTTLFLRAESRQILEDLTRLQVPHRVICVYVMHDTPMNASKLKFTMHLVQSEI